MSKEYNHKEIESKWQAEWEKRGLYHAAEKSDLPEYYTLIEFPFLSGEGLHVGHIRSYTGLDIIARKRRAEGFNVLYPIGYDAFGLPIENFAIKTGKPPALIVKNTTATFRRQLKSMGFSFDWSREFGTSDPAYYKWTQWLFLQFYKQGLAYKKKLAINWCPKDLIGLANEEVVNGCCERCGTPVEKREREQWMLAITKYADRLDKDLDEVDYLPQIKQQQRNWIGRSEGAEIEFKFVENPTPDSASSPSPFSQGEGGKYGYMTADKKLWVQLEEKALEMRKNPTVAEEKLWGLLRNQSAGYNFRRQHVISKFIVDFVCLEKLLVIEVDGDIHDEQGERDAERTEYLQSTGFKVIRFKNDEVLNEAERVLSQIKQVLEALPLGEGLGGALKIFTTRPDTIFGVTYVAVSTNFAKNNLGIDQTFPETDEKLGVFSGTYAINPANQEQIPVWIVNYVLGDVGTGAIMAVPAHDERDFEFAKKYGLPIKQVVEPYFERKDGNDRVQKDKPFEDRNAVIVIVKHWSEDKFLGLKWKATNWQGFVIGGIENGEAAAEAAVRELVEETGYTGAKFIKEVSALHSTFYHQIKEVNRVGHFKVVYLELQNGDQVETDQREKDLHDVMWIPRDKVPEFLNREDMLYSWLPLENGLVCYEGEGIVANSAELNGLSSEEAKQKITAKFGQPKVTYKLRDWVFSRQRYWGEPIPMIWCEKCQWQAVPEEQLPVELPEVERYQPTETGESPLANVSDWVNVKCPKCGGAARRETDTMPNWAGSSWYYLRYCDPSNNKEFASPESLKYWTPVDWYNGGMEHTTLHLLYSRFWHKFLFDLGLVPTSEPYQKRTSHGLILAEGGEKMSKSKGNVINPDKLVELYGADTLRLYEMFMGPFDQAIAWSTESLIGPRRFLEKVWRLKSKSDQTLGVKDAPTPSVRIRPDFDSLLHQTIKKVTEDIEAMKFNTAISGLMILVNELEKPARPDASLGGAGSVSQENYEILLKLLSPFAPHITEELWSELGHNKSIHLALWPKFDANKVTSQTHTIVVQINGVVRGSVEINGELTEAAIKDLALKSGKIQKWLAGKEIKKTIYVPSKLINFVLR